MKMFFFKLFTSLLLLSFSCECFFLSILVVDPPNMTDLDSPGPVFGASLESQLESPDYPVSFFY